MRAQKITVVVLLATLSGFSRLGRARPMSEQDAAMDRIIAGTPSATGTWASGTLRVRIEGQPPHLTGVIERAGRSFPLEATQSDDRISGAFTDEQSRFQFTASVDGSTLTLVTDGARYVLQKESTSAAGPAEADLLRLQRIEIKDDPRMIGGTALTCLIPAGWKSEGGIVWRANAQEPAGVRLRVYNPAGRDEINIYPNIPCYYSYAYRPFAPGPGQSYMGFEVRQPGDAAAVLSGLILPRYRADLPRDARIVSCDAFPEFAKAAAPLFPDDPYFPHQIEGARAHLEYTIDGTPMEEDLYWVVITTPMPSLQCAYWQPDLITSFKSVRGQLKNSESLLMTIMSSARPDVDWTCQYMRLVQMLCKQQLDSIQAIGQRTRILAQTRDQISEGLRASAERRMQITDQQHEEFCKILNGVQDYQTPGGGKVELPLGYNHAYYNGGTGEYMMSNKSLDLNKLRGNWTSLQASQ